MTTDEAVAEMLERNDDFALKCAREIARMEGWKSRHEPVKALKHIRRLLRAEDNRGFKLRWAPVIASTSVYFDDVPNLLVVPIDRAVRDAEYARSEREAESIPLRPGVRSVSYGADRVRSRA